jgi:hypothetical protein
MVSYRKRLTSSLTFFGIPAPDASALVAIALENGTFPDFYSDEAPPPFDPLRQELAVAPDELAQSILQLMYDCFYRDQLDSVHVLADAVQNH